MHAVAEILHAVLFFGRGHNECVRWPAFFTFVAVACSEAAPAATPGPKPTQAGDAAPAAACEDGDETIQRYGTDCLCCHAAEFSVAGSVDTRGPPVARIEVTDEKGVTAVMEPNGNDNFFRHYPLAGALKAVAWGPDGRAITMPFAAPDGACNRCHRAGGAAPPVHGP